MNINLKRVIVVTGGNKGIGFGILKELAGIANNNDTLIMTSRNTELGLQSYKEIISTVKGTDLETRLVYQQLDICDKASRENFIKVIAEKYSKIDVLVNNAGVAKKGNDFDSSVFDFTVGTNYFSTVDLTEEILKNNLISEYGKIVNIASGMGKLVHVKSESIKQEFLAKDLTTEKINDLCKRYRESIEKASVEADGWSKNIYAFSKICLNAYTRVLGSRKDILEKNIQVYSCCPGWVRTDMGGQNAHKSLEEGIVTPTYLINLPHKINMDFQGLFFSDSKVESIL